MFKIFFYTVATLAVLAGILSFAKIQNHIISTLIRLEFASLSLYLYLFILLNNYGAEKYVALVYLTLAACEGALGLSILVSIIKIKGNDYIKSTHFIQC